MISIFQGRGARASHDDIYVRVSVAMRDHLHLFWNGKNANALTVFLNIALHANQEGWAWPSFERIMDSTGIRQRQTMRAALRHLAGMRLLGGRVLAIYRFTGDDGQDRGYVYQIFPDAGGDPPRLTGTLTPASLAGEGVDEPTPPEADDASPARVDDASPKKNQVSTTTEPDDGAGAPAPIYIDVPQGGTRALRDSYTETCPICGPSVRLTQAMDMCPECGVTVKWRGSRPANERYRRQERARLDAVAKARNEQGERASEFTAEVLALARASSIAGRHGTVIEFNRGQREEARLAAYEQAYGTGACRRVLYDLRDRDHSLKGRSVIVALLAALERYRPPGAGRHRPLPRSFED